MQATVNATCFRSRGRGVGEGERIITHVKGTNLGNYVKKEASTTRGQTDGHGRTDGRTTDGRADRRTDGWTDGRGRAGGWTDRRAGGQADRRTQTNIDQRMLVARSCATQSPPCLSRAGVARGRRGK